MAVCTEVTYIPTSAVVADTQVDADRELIVAQTVRDETPVECC